MIDPVCSGLIAVHAGAGYHCPDKANAYKSVCKQACLKALKDIKLGKHCTEAVTSAVEVLEDSHLTNAGTGSSLTVDGHVECDASIMCGQTLKFGAVGAVKGIKNPIRVAYELLASQSRGSLSLGRIPPCFLVGEGARQWANDHGIHTANPESLITPNSLSTYKKYKKRLKRAEAEAPEFPPAKQIRRDVENGGPSTQTLLDTVGAVCVDVYGNVSSAVSSGGLALKQPGRVGQAGVFGCGCWATNPRLASSTPYSLNSGVGCTTSGCGEHLILTQLAQVLAKAVLTDENSSTTFGKVFTSDFLGSPFLSNIKSKQGGALVVKYESNSVVELIFGHTTDSMCLAYASGKDNAVKTKISRIEKSSLSGQTLVMEGVGLEV